MIVQVKLIRSVKINGYEELQLIIHHRYGHILDKIKYDDNMIINVDDEYLKTEMDKADKILEKKMSDASKNYCVKIFEHQGSIDAEIQK